MPLQTEFFFLALLPPIMFEAGFSLQVKPFFRNIGAIVALAFIGTVVSTGIVGFIMCAPCCVHPDRCMEVRALVLPFPLAAYSRTVMVCVEPLLRYENRCADRWAAGKAGFSLSLTFIQALVYGSLISTTDTVC